MQHTNRPSKLVLTSRSYQETLSGFFNGVDPLRDCTQEDPREISGLLADEIADLANALGGLALRVQ